MDWKNTSGFGRDGQPPLVAIYTGDHPKHEDQRLAFSLDRGRTWTQFEGNPVLDLGIADFRDPKVAWHEPTQRWVMAVARAADRKISFYAAPDLRHWTHLSDFGPAAATEGVWECPDLFPLPIEGESGAKKWVLTVNVGSGAPAGGPGCQYFIGEWDGTHFTADPSPTEPVSAGRVVADFEGADYAGWMPEGEAFGASPAHGTLERQQPVTGFRGKGLVNSYRDGDRTQGTLTSPPFEITADHLSFLIGGGAFAGQTCMNLLVDGSVVRTATGAERERLEWQSWDVRELRGRRATLQIVDRHTGGWGHICVDHILLADAPARGASDSTLWADFGPDFYAAVSWSDVPDGRRLWLGWMSNFRYASAVPTSPWRGAMSLPRELTLRRTTAGLCLTQQPVRELAALRGKSIERRSSTVAELNMALAAEAVPPIFECSIELSISAGGTAGVRLGSGADEATVITCDSQTRRLTVDRKHSGQTGFHREFPSAFEAPLLLREGQVRLRFLVDASSLEVFADDGTTVVTSLIFPSAQNRTLQAFGDGATVVAFDLWPLDPTPK